MLSSYSGECSPSVISSRTSTIPPGCTGLSVAANRSARATTARRFGPTAARLTGRETILCDPSSVSTIRRRDNASVRRSRGAVSSCTRQASHGGGTASKASNASASARRRTAARHSAATSRKPIAAIVAPTPSARRGATRPFAPSARTAIATPRYAPLRNTGNFPSMAEMVPPGPTRAGPVESARRAGSSPGNVWLPNPRVE